MNDNCKYFRCLQNVLQKDTHFFFPNDVVLKFCSGSMAFLIKESYSYENTTLEMYDLANLGSQEVCNDNV